MALTGFPDGVNTAMKATLGTSWSTATGLTSGTVFHLLPEDDFEDGVTTFIRYSREGIANAPASDDQLRIYFSNFGGQYGFRSWTVYTTTASSSNTLGYSSQLGGTPWSGDNTYPFGRMESQTNYTAWNINTGGWNNFTGILDSANAPPAQMLSALASVTISGIQITRGSQCVPLATSAEEANNSGPIAYNWGTKTVDSGSTDNVQVTFAVENLSTDFPVLFNTITYDAATPFTLSEHASSVITDGYELASSSTQNLVVNLATAGQGTAAQQMLDLNITIDTNIGVFVIRTVARYQGRYDWGVKDQVKVTLNGTIWDQQARYANGSVFYLSPEIGVNNSAMAFSESGREEADATYNRIRMLKGHYRYGPLTSGEFTTTTSMSGTEYVSVSLLSTGDSWYLMARANNNYQGSTVTAWPTQLSGTGSDAWWTAYAWLNWLNASTSYWSTTTLNWSGFLSTSQNFGQHADNWTWALVGTDAAFQVTHDGATVTSNSGTYIAGTFCKVMDGNAQPTKRTMVFALENTGTDESIQIAGIEAPDGLVIDSIEGITPEATAAAGSVNFTSFAIPPGETRDLTIGIEEHYGDADEIVSGDVCILYTDKDANHSEFIIPVSGAKVLNPQAPHLVVGL